MTFDEMDRMTPEELTEAFGSHLIQVPVVTWMWSWNFSDLNVNMDRVIAGIGDLRQWAVECFYLLYKMKISPPPGYDFEKWIADYGEKSSPEAIDLARKFFEAFEKLTDAWRR
jgi:hypothetical protein